MAWHPKLVQTEPATLGGHVGEADLVRARGRVGVGEADLVRGRGRVRVGEADLVRVRGRVGVSIS